MTAMRIGVSSPAAMARLVIKSQSGDREAFGQIYDETFDAVYRFAYGITRSHEDAEDVTGETYERALKAIGRYECRGIAITAWLMRIARNVAYEYARRKPTISPVDTDSLAGRAGPSVAIVDEIDLLNRCIDRLTPAQREVIALRLAGFKIREAAEILQKAEGTVKALQFNALSRLREAAHDA